MFNNYTQKLEMQIPHENTQIGTTMNINQKEKLNKFLKSNFKFPSNNLNEIQKVIFEDYEMEKIFYDLPEIIAKEFPNDDLLIDFSNNDKKEIDVTILTSLNGKLSCDKQELIDEELFDNYSWDAVNKILVCVEFKC